MYRIFLVEDEEHLNGVLSAYLESEGWQVRSFQNGGEGRQAIGERPDLWILDIMLPGIDGYQLLREIKADQPRLPVIFISARDADIDRVVGLELGSDDYMAKPFLPRELVIRTRKLLERVYGDGRQEAEARGRAQLLVPPYIVDEDGRTVRTEKGKAVDLTSKEFDLIVYFGRHAGQLLDREQVLAGVWGSDYYGSDRVVDDLVRRLRRKLPQLRLETVYGYGYRLVKA
ncbi:two-component system response regulator [Paenibacillus elgii]|uniref:Two-component system response regulator n=1 Tax=Paenibacillus elgii TaxID=189691 RepID=A0A165QJX4_9BACL|nr:response regulator transcription factor [Paenibacillus elgii]KZE75329.1 two-component system response regulator [Paenibacillus elgii]